ncbi:MAG: nuclear transport factor 2 family protein [Acidobacteriota bacterium]|nr:nuclear transport factor 2 family protein [Acidobacteriota bacterium]
MQQVIAFTMLTLAVPAIAAAQAGVRASDSRARAHDASHAADTSHQSATDDAARITEWLKGYDAAFNAKDLDTLATYYHPDVTIYEGGGINNGWADYRDHHLGPELKAFENLQFGHTEQRVHVLGDGRTAYAVSQYFLKAKIGERNIDTGGLETLVLVKDATGAWKIRHTHTSARPRRPAGGGM